MNELDLHGLVKPQDSPIILHDRTGEIEGMANILQSA